MHGVISKVSQKGFGFIKFEDGSSVYFHAKDVRGGITFDRLRAQDKVIVGYIEQGEKGSIAREVKLDLQ